MHVATYFIAGAIAYPLLTKEFYMGPNPVFATFWRTEADPILWAYVYLAEGAIAALYDWLQIRGPLSGSLFYPINKKEVIFPRKISNQAIYNILRKRGKAAQTSKYSPHDLRRTFVSDLLGAGADIAVVSRMAGNASV